MGLRELDPDRRIFNARADTIRLETHEPKDALDQLHQLDRRHVFLEGGPALAASFVRQGLVDEVVAYLAPALLGAGTSAVGDLGIETIDDTLRLRITDVATVGTGPDANVRLTMTFTDRTATREQ
jgi:diaminohydroxyphosphoribosylaminopyrimidine deaminase/5-amino-6-(5-phosphoribosylamino)uracil reductase